MKNVENDMNMYASCVKRYARLFQEQYEKKPNEEKSTQFDRLKVMLRYIEDCEYEKIKIKKTSELEYNVSFYCKTILKMGREDSCLFPKVLAKMLTKYDEFLIQVNDKKEIVMSFTIKLYDEMKIKDNRKELKELENKMRELAKDLENKELKEND